MQHLPLVIILQELIQMFNMMVVFGLMDHHAPKSVNASGKVGTSNAGLLQQGEELVMGIQILNLNIMIQ